MSPESQSTAGLAAAAVSAETQDPGRAGRSPLEQHFAAAVRAMPPPGTALRSPTPTRPMPPPLARLADGARPGPLTVVGADPAGGLADRRALPGAVRRPAGQPAPGPGRRAELRARGAGLLHHRLVRPRGQRRASPPRCGSPTRPCCTTARARFYLARAAQAEPAAGRGRRRAARPGGRAGRADRGRPAQGLRPPRPERSSRRPRRSPRTCRARSAWPSRWRQRAAQARRCRAAVAATTRSWCAASATPRSTTPPRPAPSTPPPTAPTRACRCRCCSSARTTAWASACGPRRAGSRRARSPARRSRYFRADGCDLAARLRRGADRGRAGSASAAPRRSCTCARSGSAGTPGSDVESAYRDAGRDRRGLRPRPAAAHRPAARRGRRARPRPRCSTATRQSRRRVLALAGRGRRRAPADLGRRRSWRRWRRARPHAVAASLRRGRAGRRHGPGTGRSAAQLPEDAGPADAGPGDQPDPGRRAGRPARHAGLRRGRRPARAASTA